MSAPIKIPLPLRGVDMLSEETTLTAGYVRAAENVDIDKSGAFSRRSGQTLVNPNVDTHSVYYWANRGWLLVAKGSAVFRVDPSTYAGTFVCAMGASDRVDFQEINGDLYMANTGSLWRVRAGEDFARTVGVAAPAAVPSVEPVTVGTFIPGAYMLAIAAVDDLGEESPLKAIGVTELPAAGGFKLTGLAVDLGRTYRVYVSPPDGDEMYLATEFLAASAEQFVGEQPDGAQRASQHLEVLTPGSMLRQHAGRLYSVNGDTVTFSEPMRPHLTRPGHNFIRFVGSVRMCEPVEGGIFIGDDTGVVFLEGNDPVQFRRRQVSTHRVIAGSAIKLPGASIPVSEVSTATVVWLSEAGYYLGLAGGSARALHPEKLAVAEHLTGKSAFVFRNGTKQIITLVDATTSQTFGVAIDTQLQ